MHLEYFKLIDRIVDLNVDERTITVEARVPVTNTIFEGHFPGHPIMPGVLQLEAMAQVAGVLLLKIVAAANQVAYFMSAENVKWRKPVFPGDVLIIEVELTKARGKIGKGRGVCKVGGEIVSEAEITFMLRDA